MTGNLPDGFSRPKQEVGQRTSALLPGVAGVEQPFDIREDLVHCAGAAADDDEDHVGIGGGEFVDEFVLHAGQIHAAGEAVALDEITFAFDGVVQPADKDHDFGIPGHVFGLGKQAAVRAVDIAAFGVAHPISAEQCLPGLAWA